MKNEKQRMPNVLILHSDQHSARALGCYGNKQVITPNLDRLARDGIKIDPVQDVYAQRTVRP